MSRLLSWMRVALVDLRGDLRRFGVLLGCLALGTGTIAAVGSVGAALHATIIRDASTLLGGDIEVARSDRRANEEELAYLMSLGTLAETVDTNARGRAGENSIFLDILGVNGNYPLFGRVRSPQLAAGERPIALLGEVDGVHGAIIDPVLLDRLGIEFGGHFTIGETRFEVRGLLTSVPDGAVRGFHLGLTTIIALDAVDIGPDARLPLPGLLTEHRYKIRLFEGTYQDAAPVVQAHLAGDTGWTLRTPYDAAGTLSRFYDRFVRFLLIVGLSSLLVGGVGISNAVSAYIAERQRSIATLRSLGATGPRILVHIFTQVGIMSLVGIAIGLALGAVSTLAALPILGPILGVDLPPSVDAPSLLVATGFGVLAAFAFSYLPLVSARKLRPAILFRSVGASIEALPAREYLTPGVLIPLAVAGLGMFALAVITTQDLNLVLWYAAGVTATFVLLRAAAALLQRGLRALPALPNPVLRNAFRGICRPGSPAPAVVLSLGLGLAMLLVIVILDNNLHSQLVGEVQQDAPTFVTTDLFEDEIPELKAFLDATGMLTTFRSSPMMRAAITQVRGIPSDQFINIDEELVFMLDGEIPVTWATDLPEQTSVVEGQWWPSDYDGPPLVSLRTRARDGLGLKIGDTLELTVLGEKIEARIASFRDYQFRNGLNFLVTFSPHALDAFPESWLATIKITEGDEQTVERALAREFPELTFIPVGEGLNQAADLLNQLGVAVNIVGGLAVVNGVLVLAGTMAAGRKQREADAIVSKVLGATRAEVVTVFAVEYALLGAFAALIATFVGIAGAWSITLRLLDVGFGIDPVLVLAVLIGAVALTIATGAITTWSALSTRPAQYLRNVG
ncbi:MAG: FtsX-like permease family protein [Cucumibacter sp.]